MPHRLTDPFVSPLRLSQSVVQAGDMLGLMRAEVARVLGFRCEDISALYEGRLLLEPASQAWEQGTLFVRFYQALYDHMQGQGPQMIHWLRADKKDFANSPFYLIVDEGRLSDVLGSLETEQAATD